MAIILPSDCNIQVNYNENGTDEYSSHSNISGLSHQTLRPFELSSEECAASHNTQDDGHETQRQTAAHTREMLSPAKL